MTEKKQCSKCKTFQPLDGYNDGRTQCNMCLGNKRRYREKHHEELREKAKEYYRINKGRKQEYQRQYCQQVIECSTCKVMIQKCKVKRHEQSGTHLHNLNNPDNLKLSYKQQHEEKLKQQEQQQKQLKEERRKEHEKIITYLNENFPSYPAE